MSAQPMDDGGARWVAPSLIAAGRSAFELGDMATARPKVGGSSPSAPTRSAGGALAGQRSRQRCSSFMSPA
jgi:hypothetical protein